MEKINILGVLKGVTELAVSAGVGVIVGNLVKATTPEDTSRYTKVLTAIGGYGLAGVLGDLAAKHVSSSIDGYSEKVHSILHPTKESISDEMIEYMKSDVEDSVLALQYDNDGMQALRDRLNGPIEEDEDEN